MPAQIKMARPRHRQQLQPHQPDHLQASQMGLVDLPAKINRKHYEQVRPHCMANLCRFLTWFIFTAAATQFPVARLIQAVMESVPANADVHVEINQNPQIGFESQIEIQPAANSTGAATSTTSTETGKFQPNKQLLLLTCL